MRIKIFLHVLSLTVLIAAQTGCDNNSKAQQADTELELAFSGSFVPAPASTDTNGDGRPATLRTYEGESGFGNTIITILDEFAQPVPPVNCPADNLEFNLVRGSFVIRVGNGDLLLGGLESGISCFDPVARRSEIFEEGNFTGGHGAVHRYYRPRRDQYKLDVLEYDGCEWFRLGRVHGGVYRRDRGGIEQADGASGRITKLWNLKTDFFQLI